MPLLYDKFEILNDEYNSIWEFMIMRSLVEM